MKRLIPPALLLLCFACKTPNGNNNTGPSGNTGNSGPVSDPCDLDDKDGIIGLTGPVTATTAGAACSKDFNCSMGQMCQSSMCTVVSDPDKLHAELVIPSNGTYVVSMYWPAESASETSPDEVFPVNFEFANARRDQRVFRLAPRVAPLDAKDQAALSGRIRAEAVFRARERLALTQPESFYVAAPEGGVGPSRQTTCTAEQIKWKGTCYSVGSDLPPFKMSQSTGMVNVIVTVKKVIGSTAILLDKDDASASQGDIDALATAFDTIAGPRDRKLFNKGNAHTGALLDSDGNNMVGIVLSTKVGQAGVGVVGFFDVRDVLATGTSAGPNMANGNEADIMWMLPPNVSYTPAGAAAATSASVDLVAGTLAHEYQHMINLARARAVSATKIENKFLDEALAHLAEDLTGYGASNVGVISAYLSKPNASGLYIDSNGVDGDHPDGQMRGIVYLYLRYMFEKQGGFHVAEDGTITDLGGIAFIEKLMSSSQTGLANLSQAGASTYKRFPLFFPTLVTSQSADAPLVKDDCRFNFNPTGIDPQTKQPTGIKLNDPSRKDASGKGGLLTGYTQICDKAEAEANQCKMYATGGLSFLLENASANEVIRIRADSGYNLRLTAVRVK